ncbi:hypothetical protein KORDIASMS9_02283 [Kordia sp. SMS9]|uniref:DUF4136 domain-containing protein n=1 Tax=Kordia sp. SMS9 TaxID=2282170 RepID=UPI000E0CDED4|nr:DUF4136 domain-containing protein [Kordia sp. SMS9]AXG70054.1 hypothetical protein KORDIASMS9_02283 [Kordia sp. SMS9]
MKYIGALLVFMLMVSCTAPKAVYDYDRKTDFSKYRTYNFFPDIDTGLSELNDKRIFRLTDSIMQARGFRRTATPDFYINIETAAFEPDQDAAVGVGVGGGGRNTGGGISIGLPIGSSKRNQEVVIDLVDVRQDQLFWQAIVEGYFKEEATPEERKAYFRAILLKAFEKFPPEK